MIEEPKINRNLALELLRVTEAGALAAAPLQGRGDKEEADVLSKRSGARSQRST
jgi:fructose-1,6-bisphosphatase/sedoheptulose 1,7-bisphosphatase-like protein